MSRGGAWARGVILALAVLPSARAGEPGGAEKSPVKDAAGSRDGDAAEGYEEQEQGREEEGRTGSVPAKSREGDPQASPEARGALATWTERWDLRGRWRLRARHRRAGDESDTDLQGVASLHATLPAGEAPGGAPEITARFEGAFDLDLDTFERSPARSAGHGGTFADLSNTYDRRFHANLVSAWVQARTRNRSVLGRLGRQTLAEAGGFLFDGARIDLRPAGSNRLRWSFEAGVPVHLYESSPAGDLLAGTQGRARVSETVDASAGYVYVRDRGGFVGQKGDHHVYGKLRWRPNRSWTAQVGASAIDFDAFRETIDFGWTASDARKSIRLRVVHQDPLDQPFTTEFSPFLSTLGRLAPYVQARLQGEAEVAGGVRLAGGFSARQLVEGAPESTFNRDYRNVFAEASVDERLWKGFGATLRGDYWDSGRGNIATTGFEVRQRFGENTAVKAGTDFSLYRVDLFSGTERQQDRTWFVELDRSVGDTFHVGLRYVFENDELDDTQTFVVLVTQSF